MEKRAEVLFSAKDGADHDRCKEPREMLRQEILHQSAVGLIVGKSLALINLIGGKTRQHEVEGAEQLQCAGKQYTFLTFGKA